MEIKKLNKSKLHFFKGTDIPEYKLKPIIGDSLKNGVKGSTGYYIKATIADLDKVSLENSKAHFEAFTQGFLIRFYKNNQTLSIPIPFDSIIEFELIKGEETINPWFFSPMWILLKVGVPIDIARYFRIQLSEYGIDETSIKLKSTDFEIFAICNGYTFSSQALFFSNYGHKYPLKIKYT